MAYLERLSRHDAAELRSGGCGQHLHDLVRLFAAEGQSELVAAKMARQIGVTENTVRSYIELNEAMSPGGFEYFGALVEQFVVSELKKQNVWSQTQYRLYHYRQRDKEVDVVVELANGSLILIEVKSSTRVLAVASFLVTLEVFLFWPATTLPFQI